MAIDTADLPGKIVIFHSYVSLPEGKYLRWENLTYLQGGSIAILLYNSKNAGFWQTYHDISI